MILEILCGCVYDRVFIYQVFVTLITYSALRIGLFIRTRRRRFKLFEFYGIPGPAPRLLDGNMHLYLSEPAGYKIDNQLRTRYGRTFGVFIGDEPNILTSDPEIIRAAFLDRVSSFQDRATFFIGTPLTESILFARHDRWRFLRKVMAPAFNGYTMRGNASTQFIETSIELMLEYIENKLDVKTKKVNIDMHNLMQAAALHLIANIAVRLPNVQVREGDKSVATLNTFLATVDKGVMIQAARFPFLKRPLTFLANHFEHNATMRSIHDSMRASIDAHSSEAGGGGGDSQLMDTLIKLYHGGRLSYAELMGNAQALLIAGYDTTSTTLAYIFWVLGKHRAVQERLRSELMAHGIESEYLDQVLSESMRLYPAVNTFAERRATETVEVNGLTIPQGTQVVFNCLLVQRDPNNWPDPDSFDPERFRRGAEIDPGTYAPFGLGERKCLGLQLARLEIKMITCDLLLRYRLTTRAPQRLELNTYAESLTKPSEKIMIELERL